MLHIWLDIAKSDSQAHEHHAVQSTRHCNLQVSHTKGKLATPATEPQTKEDAIRNESNDAAISTTNKPASTTNNTSWLIAAEAWKNRAFTFRDGTRFILCLHRLALSSVVDSSSNIHLL